MEYARVLGNEEHLALPCRRAKVVHFAAVYPNGAPLGKLEASQQGGERALPAPAGSDDAHVLESAQLQAEGAAGVFADGVAGAGAAVGLAVGFGPALVEVGEGDVLEFERAFSGPCGKGEVVSVARRVLSACNRVSLRLRVVRPRDQLQQMVECFAPVQAGMKVGGEGPQRVGDLGSQDKTGEPYEESQRAVHQPKREHDGDGRQAQHADEVQGRARGGGNAQSAHGGLAEPLAAREHLALFRLGRPEGLERAQAA